MATNLVNCTQYQTKKLNPTNKFLKYQLSIQRGVDPLDGALKWAEKSFPKLQNESVGVYTSFNETSNKSENEMTTNEKNLWTANQEKQKLEQYLIG